MPPDSSWLVTSDYLPAPHLSSVLGQVGASMAVGMALVDEIGARMAALRAARGLTLRALAELSGVSHQMLGMVEHGQNVTLAKIEPVLVALEARLVIQDLRRGEGLPPVPPDLPDSRRDLARRFLRVLVHARDEDLKVAVELVELLERLQGTAQTR